MAGEVKVFYIPQSQLGLASELLKEAQALRASTAELNIVPSQAAHRTTGIRTLRTELREKVLIANGVNPSSFAPVWRQRQETLEKAYREFPLDEMKGFIEKRRPNGQLTFHGELPRAETSTRRLIKACRQLVGAPEDFEVDYLSIWELGYSRVYLNEKIKDRPNPNFNPLHPRSATFLFKDEREVLRRERGLVISADFRPGERNKDEALGMEAYLVYDNYTVSPSISLRKVIAWFIDPELKAMPGYRWYV